MTSYRSLNHTKWACQYHVVFIPKYRKKAIYADLRRYLGDVLRPLGPAARERGGRRALGWSTMFTSCCRFPRSTRWRM